MNKSFIISLIAHFLIISLSVIVWPSSASVPKFKPKPVMVDLVDNFSNEPKIKAKSEGTITPKEALVKDIKPIPKQENLEEKIIPKIKKPKLNDTKKNTKTTLKPLPKLKPKPSPKPTKKKLLPVKKPKKAEAKNKKITHVLPKRRPTNIPIKTAQKETPKEAKPKEILIPKKTLTAKKQDKTKEILIPKEQITAKKAPKMETKPKEEQLSKLTDSKSKFNADELAALLNKLPDDPTKSSKPLPQEKLTPTKEEQPITPLKDSQVQDKQSLGDIIQKQIIDQSDGIDAGDSLTMSQNEIDALRSQIHSCWVIPPAAMNAGEVSVKLKLYFTIEGNLKKAPDIINQQNNEYFNILAESTIRAAQECQPYFLPKEKYELWQEAIINFNPSDMYRTF